MLENIDIETFHSRSQQNELLLKQKFSIRQEKQPSSTVLRVHLDLDGIGNRKIYFAAVMAFVGSLPI